MEAKDATSGKEHHEGCAHRGVRRTGGLAGCGGSPARGDPASALSVAPLSAFYCLRRLADLKSGETVLVWAAASGVGDAGVEVVLDTVGERRFGESLKMAGSGGRVVVLANVALEESVIDTRDFYPRNVTIHGFQINNLMQSPGYDPRTDLVELADLAVTGALEVHVDAAFPLDRAADAHRHLEARRNRGKVVIHPGE